MPGVAPPIDRFLPDGPGISREMRWSLAVEHINRREPLVCWLRHRRCRGFSGQPDLGIVRVEHPPTPPAPAPKPATQTTPPKK